MIVPRVEYAHVECIDEENNNEEWERESHVAAILDLNEEEDVFAKCFMEEDAHEEGIGDGYMEYAHQVSFFKNYLMEETPIYPNPIEGDDENNEFDIFDLLINDVDVTTNVNHFDNDEVAGRGEEACISFEASSKVEKHDEVGEPLKSGRIEKVEYDYSLAMASKNDYLVTDLHVLHDIGNFGDVIFLF